MWARIRATVIVVDAVVELGCLRARVDIIGQTITITIPIDAVGQARILFGILCIDRLLNFARRSILGVAPNLGVAPKFGAGVVTETSLSV